MLIFRWSCTDSNGFNLWQSVQSVAKDSSFNWVRLNCLRNIFIPNFAIQLRA